MEGEHQVVVFLRRQQSHRSGLALTCAEPRVLARASPDQRRLCDPSWSRIVLVAIFSVCPLVARGAYVTMVDNGPSSNRVNVMFLGDGYTASEIATTYVGDINAMWDHMFNAGEDPFPRYRNFFNAYRIDVISNQSGADVPPLGIFRDTALDASYYFDQTTERLLSVNPDKANAAIGAGVAGTGLQVDIRMVTVNDTRYGGGGGGFAVYAGGNPQAPEIALHELGHSFAGLGDQYGGMPGPYAGPEPSQPDITKSPVGEKWSQWLGYNQPGIGVIGAYEGAGYYDSGLYRPSLNSKMRTLGNPFDAIGRESIILSIYKQVDPLDLWLANSAALTDPASLWVDTVDPAVIDVEWLVNGQAVPGAQGESFRPRDYGFEPGSYSVTAHAFDPTDWVRGNRESLEQSVSWNVVLTAILGDLNDDGLVNIFDMNMISTNWGQSGPNGDANGDHLVDIFDINLVSENWTPTAGATNVPEPGTLTLFASSGLALLWLVHRPWRRRRGALRGIAARMLAHRGIR
jgi:IgA Peptidase M64